MNNIIEISGIWTRYTKIDLVDSLIERSSKSIFINFGYVIGGEDAKYVLDKLIQKKNNFPQIKIIVCLIMVRNNYSDEYMNLLKTVLDEVFVLYHGIITTSCFPYFHLSVCHHKCALFDECELIIGSNNYKDGFLYPKDINFSKNNYNFVSKRSAFFHTNIVTKTFLEFDIYIKFKNEYPDLLNKLYKVISGITVLNSDLIGSNFKFDFTGINYGRKYPIIDILQNTTNCVDLVCFHLWPRGEFYNELIRLLKNRVRIRVIIPASESITTYFFYIVCMYHIYRLSYYGEINYSTICIGSSMHIKMIVSDNSNLLMSSANYNDKSLNQKIESELWCYMWGDKTKQVIREYKNWTNRIIFKKYDRNNGLFGWFGDTIYRGTMNVISSFIEWMF